MIQSTTSPRSPRCISPDFLTRIPPAALQSPSSQPQNTRPCQSSTLPRQLKRSEARTSTMQCTVDPARQTILIITLTLLGRPWRGMALRTSTARKGPLTSAAVKRAFVPKRPCHSQYGSRKSDVPLKVRYSNNPSSFFYSSPYRFGHEYGALELSPVCQ